MLVPEFAKVGHSRCAVMFSEECQGGAEGPETPSTRSCSGEVFLTNHAKLNPVSHFEVQSSSHFNFEPSSISSES